MTGWEDTIKITIVSCFPILWLLLIYSFDHFCDFLESNFYKKPLKLINNDEAIIRELCPRRITNDEDCRLFKNLDYFLSEDRNLVKSCTLNPWFKEDDFRNSNALAKKILNPEQGEKILAFIKDTLSEDERQLVESNINPENGKEKQRLKTCLKKIFNRIIRDQYIYNEDRFANVKLDKNVLNLAKLTLESKNRPSSDEEIKYLELNRLLLEASLNDYFNTKNKVNRLWKLMLENVVLCMEQAKFFEFIAVETAVIYLTRSLTNKQNDNISFILFFLLMLALAFWTTTLSRSEPYPFFYDTKLRLYATIALLIFAIYFINA